MSGPHTLVILASGAAQLEDKDGEPVWFSDSDDDFRAEFDDDFLTADDVEDIGLYLRDQGILSDDDLTAMEVAEEDDEDGIDDVIDVEVDEIKH